MQLFSSQKVIVSKDLLLRNQDPSIYSVKVLATGTEVPPAGRREKNTGAIDSKQVP